jgi:hypothetical protein
MGFRFLKIEKGVLNDHKSATEVTSISGIVNRWQHKDYMFADDNNT